MVVQDHVEYITPEDLRENRDIKEMAEAESGRLKEDPKKAGFLAGFLSSALKDGGMKAEVFRFLMEEHFFESVSPSAEEYCRELLHENADAAWYALVLAAFRERKNPDGFCREIVYALKNHLNVDEVEGYFRVSKNVFQMKAARNALMEKRGYDPAGRAAMDICADVERAVAQFSADCGDYHRQNLEIQKMADRQAAKISELTQRAGEAECRLQNVMGSAKVLRLENARLHVDNKNLSGKIDAMHKRERMMSVQLERIKEQEKRLHEKNNRPALPAALQKEAGKTENIRQLETVLLRDAILQSTEESRKLRELVKLAYTDRSLLPSGPADERKENGIACDDSARLAQNAAEGGSTCNDSARLAQDHPGAGSTLSASDRCETENRMLRNAPKSGLNPQEKSGAVLSGNDGPVCMFLDGQPHTPDNSAGITADFLKCFEKIYMRQQTEDFCRLSTEEKNSRLFARAMQMKFDRERIRHIRGAVEAGIAPEAVFAMVLQDASLKEFRECTAAAGG